MQVRRLDDDTLICRDLVLGESFGQRFMGLMGRASLPEGAPAVGAYQTCQSSSHWDRAQ